MYLGWKKLLEGCLLHSCQCCNDKVIWGVVQLKWLTMEDDHRLSSGPSPSACQIVVYTALGDKVPVDFAGLLLTLSHFISCSPAKLSYLLFTDCPMCFCFVTDLATTWTWFSFSPSCLSDQHQLSSFKSQLLLLPSKTVGMTLAVSSRGLLTVL